MNFDAYFGSLNNPHIMQYTFRRYSTELPLSKWFTQNVSKSLEFNKLITTQFSFA